ncbi:MAG: hypothetical protein GF347_05030 [Candidatus Moranbacteria bacterium]|nr:hypothetical protein [Candidatus Moranbacteria bacterium]
MKKMMMILTAMVCFVSFAGVADAGETIYFFLLGELFHVEVPVGERNGKTGIINEGENTYITFFNAVTVGFYQGKELLSKGRILKCPEKGYFIEWEEVFFALGPEIFTDLKQIEACE